MTSDGRYRCQKRENFPFLKKWANPGLFFIYFRLFETHINFLHEINMKNVHSIYSAWIQTHDLWNMSFLP